MAVNKLENRTEHSCDYCGTVYPLGMLAKDQHNHDVCPACVKRYQETNPGPEIHEAGSPVANAVQPGSDKLIPLNSLPPEMSRPSEPMHPNQQPEYYKSLGISDVARVTSNEEYDAAMRATGHAPQLEETQPPSPTPESMQSVPEGVTANVESK